MNNHTTTEKTRSLLTARGDIELISDAMIELEIESDGVAWISVLDVECCYRPDDDVWIVVAPGFKRYSDLGDAMRAALVADAERDQRTPSERILAWVFEELPEAEAPPRSGEDEEDEEDES